MPDFIYSNARRGRTDKKIKATSQITFGALCIMIAHYCTMLPPFDAFTVSCVGAFRSIAGHCFLYEPIKPHRSTHVHMLECLRWKSATKNCENVKKNANILTTRITDVFVVLQITMSSYLKLRVSHWPMFDIKSPQEHPSAMPITATSELVQSFLLPNDSEICPTLVFCLNEEPL